MFAYCNNNPINCYDPSGEGLRELARFSDFIGAGFLALTALIIPQIVELPTVSLPRSPVESSFKSAAKARAKKDSQAEELAPARIKNSQNETKIYRYGGSNPGNLTPRESDWREGGGLSFSTVPRGKCVETTIEAINATGIVYAVQDGLTHVSVYPVGHTVEEWEEAGPDSIWTHAVKSVVTKVKWDGD